MDRWNGKIAVVTGASAGIGAAIVEELAKAGVKVFGLARRVERVEELKQKLGEVKGEIIPIKCDVSKEDEILAAFKTVKEKYGTVHILVNNAGIARLGGLTETKLDRLKEVFDVNVFGLTCCTQQAFKLMKESGVNDGHIIHINSVLGHYVPNQGNPIINVYPATKHAVIALTKALRQELKFLDTKIKVTSISPGAVDTEILQASAIGSGEKENVFDQFKDIPRLKSKDVADAVVYVLSTPPHLLVHELILTPLGENF